MNNNYNNKNNNNGKSSVFEFLTTPRQQQEQHKMVNTFKCKKHGNVNIKYDKLINVGGKKFCPFCVAELLEHEGVCQLKRDKINKIDNPKRNYNGNSGRNRWNKK